MMPMQFINKRLCLCTVTALLAACSHFPAVHEQRTLCLSVQAASDINPDDKGRATPVVVQIIALTSAARFNTAPFLSLQDALPETLGDTLLATEEIILRPGETKATCYSVHEDASAIGVVAAYRDLPKATWRQVHVLAAASETAWWHWILPRPAITLRIGLSGNVVHLMENQEQ
jgi:type VI secretion system protein VasD